MVDKARSLFQRKKLENTPRDGIFRGASTEEFWALRDVNFEIKRGEVVGIIGRNGAGKSTLLKVLSRITEPTMGRVHLKGRVASLLEVGTGFHPELTGRENIFLNGAILGMSRTEIRRKFDEIVAFAEVSKFLDTPVKRYSSGMYVRLAFAVAAHLEPEILIVDEVLAVGDTQFQKKCLGKMQEVSRGGRTVLFVSHNMNAVRTLCTKAIYFDAGRIRSVGSVDQCIALYFAGAEGGVFKKASNKKKEKPEIVSIEVDSEKLTRGHLCIVIEVESPRDLMPPIFGIVLYNQVGVPVFGSNLQSHPNEVLKQPMRNGKVAFEVNDLPLKTGHYTASFFLGDSSQHYVTIEHGISFFLVNPNPPQFNLSLEANGSLNWPATWNLLEKF